MVAPDVDEMQIALREFADPKPPKCKAGLGTSRASTSVATSPRATA
jgi:hypothetical protein